MRKLLAAFLVLMAAMTCVLTGAVIGVGYYQSGYSQGEMDEENCFENDGGPCDQGDEEMMPAHRVPGRHGHRVFPTHRRL